MVSQAGKAMLTYIAHLTPFDRLCATCDELTQAVHDLNIELTRRAKERKMVRKKDIL